MSVTHDTLPAGKVRKAHVQNLGHAFGGGALGSLLYRDTGASDGASWLAAVAAGSFLRSAGVGAAPAWSTLTLPNAAVQGDLLYASASNVIGSLADVAAGSVLVSGGVGAAPAWSNTPTLTGLTLGATASALGVPVHVLRESQGVTTTHLAPTQYVFIGESEDAVIALFSEREGDHGSGIEFVEMFPAGTLVDKWSIIRQSSNAGDGALSSLGFNYGAAVDYASNPRVIEFTKNGQIILGTSRHATTQGTAPGLYIFGGGTGSLTPHIDTIARAGLILEQTEGRIQIIGDGAGNNNSALMLSSALDGGAPNRHWSVHHRGTGQSSRLDFQYGTSVASGDVLAGLTSVMQLTTAGALTLSSTASATGFLVGATPGVDGTFTTADAKTVTVTKGIITSIAP